MVPDNICRVWWSTYLWDGSSPSPYSTSTLWLLKNSQGAALKWKLPLALDWMDHGWWTDTAVCTSSKDGSTLYPRRWMNWALSLQLWHCSSFIQPNYSPTHWIQSLLCFCFYLSLNFSRFASHLWVRQCVFVSAHVSVFQSKNCRRAADRQMCSAHWHMNTPDTHSHSYTCNRAEPLYCMWDWAVLS